MIITNMFESRIGVGVYTYFVYGFFRNIETDEITTLAVRVNLDNTNRTFSLLLYNYLETNNYLNINETSKINLSETNKIEDKGENTYTFNYIKDTDYINYLFTDYIDTCLFDIERAYENLENEYKNKKFGNLDNFTKYINDKKGIYETYDLKNMKQYEDFNNMDDYTYYINTFKPLEIVSFEKKKTANYMQYVLIDSYNNYYIFRETGAMKYKVILDIYTIDLPEYEESYEGSDNKGKIELNIQKIVSALNEKDYKYVYGKLNNTFKEDNFKSYEIFEEYASKTFGTGNEIIFDKYIETSSYGTYEISLKNNQKTVNKTIIMKLLDGMDFMMSFDV